jgi:protein phosphatase
VRIAAGVATDIGRVREANEDAYLAEHPLYAVADGMGGHRGGEVASQLALETLEGAPGSAPLGDRVRDANRAVFERSGADRSVSGMGTTLTAALFTPDGLDLAHVGDSRAYLLRAGDLRRLTEDHTLVNRMVRAGEITPDEAEVHPHRNVLLRSLGTEPDVDVDEQHVALLDGDRVLVCSDGLTGMIAEDQLRAIAEATPDPQEAADRLVTAANRAGGVDNITVLVIDVRRDDDEELPPPVERVRTRPSPVRIAVIAGVTIVMTLAALTLVRAWIDSRWFVGVSDGRVAIYQGIPATVLGIDLSSVDLVTSVDAEDALALPFWDELEDGINVGSRQEALDTIARIEADIAEATDAANAQEGTA